MFPQTGSRRYTHVHLKWFMGTLVFSTLHCRGFSFFIFYFLFFAWTKKHKNANKRMGYFFPLRCFLSAFFIFVRLFAFCAFAWLRFCVFLVFFGAFCVFGAFCAFCALCAFWYFFCFWCFWCVQNLSVKKKLNF